MKQEERTVNAPITRESVSHCPMETPQDDMERKSAHAQLQVPSPLVGEDEGTLANGTPVLHILVDFPHRTFGTAAL